MTRLAGLVVVACTPPPAATSAPDTDSGTSGSPTSSTGSAPSGHQWSARFGDDELQGLDALGVDSDGDVVVMGRFAGTLAIGDDTLVPEVSGGAQEVYLARFAADGTPVRAVTLGATFGWDLAVDRSDSVVVCGQTSSGLDLGGGPIPAWSGLFVAKFDASGAHQLSRGWPGVIPLAELHPTRVSTDPSGNLILGGSLSEATDFGAGLIVPQTFDAYVLSLDPAGSVTWSTGIGGLGHDLIGDVAADPDGNVVAIGSYDHEFTLGTTMLEAGPGRSLFVASLDAAGTPRWAHGYAADVAPRMSVATAPNGDVVILAEVSSETDFGGGLVPIGGASDLVLIRLAVDGAHVSSRVLGGAGVTDALGEVTTDADGNAIATGGFQGTWDFGDGEHTAVQTDQFLVAVDRVGSTLWSHRFGDVDLQWGRAVAVSPAGAIVTGATGDGRIDYGGGLLEGAGSLDVFLHQRLP